MIITDEIRVVIAAQACLLLLHRDTDYYPDLKSILVYGPGIPLNLSLWSPSAFSKSRDRCARSTRRFMPS